MRATARLLGNLPTAKEIKRDCRKIVCVGRNYADHIAELNNQRPKSPFFFLKPPSSILLPNEGPVRRARGVDMHYEVELGLVVGQQLRDLDAADDAKAMSAIRCYLIAVDLTARNMQNQAKKAGLPWSMAKGFDTFCPISRPFDPSRFPLAQFSGQTFPNPYAGHLYLNVNGQAKQSDSIGLMLFNISRLLSEFSKVMTLEPGDLVLTGTPKGVGPLAGGESIDIGCCIGDEKGPEIDEAKTTWEITNSTGAFEFVE